MNVKYSWWHKRPGAHFDNSDNFWIKLDNKSIRCDIWMSALLEIQTENTA